MANSTVQPRAEILAIGDELLLGEIVDTNTPYMARLLLPLGISVAHYQTSGDEIEEIAAALVLALSRAEIVIATGGLGPTDDDLTVEAVAQALGVALEHREEVMDQMAARLKRPKDQFSASNRKQALLPAGARVLRNDWGTAPGIHCAAPGGRHLFLMPGVPREMKGLYEAWVLPFLREHYPPRGAIAIKHLHAFGIPESQVGERLKELMRPGLNPDVGTRVNDGVVTVRVVARGADRASAEGLLVPAVARVRAALEEGFFGEDDETFAGATAKALLERRKTVAFAESCTAGLAASTLAQVSGISAALLEGAVCYANASKVRACGVRQETLDAHGAVSAETARELAEGIRLRSGADFGLAITGIAGPAGGTPGKPVGLVIFALAAAAGTQVFERQLAGLDRQAFRERAAFLGLDFLRRAALELAP